MTSTDEDKTSHSITIMQHLNRVKTKIYTNQLILTEKTVHLYNECFLECIISIENQLFKTIQQHVQI